MKIVALVLALGIVVGSASEAEKGQQPSEETAVSQKAHGLQLYLVVDKHRCKPDKSVA